MNIVFDLFFVVLIAAGFAVGWWRGFISFFAKPLKFVGAVILASVFGAKVADEIVSVKIADTVRTKIDTALGAQNSKSVWYKLCNKIADKAAIPVSFDDSEDFVSYVSDFLTVKISYAIAIVALFLGGLIAISLIVILVKNAVKKGPVGIVDHTLGLVLGGGLVFLLFLGLVRVMNADAVNIGLNINTDNSLFYPFLLQFQPLEFIQNIIRKIQ